MSLDTLHAGRADNPAVSAEDPQRTVQTFIDLVQRHEQSFYTFVHNVHSKGQGLFDSLMAWIELFLNYARDGLPHPVDLEFILPHGGPEREAIMAEVDAVAQYHYKLKLAHEEKVRRRFDQATNAEASEEAALLGSVMATLSLSETAVGDAKELGEEQSDDDDEEDQHDDESQDSISIRSFPPPSSVDTPPTASSSSVALTSSPSVPSKLAPPDEKVRRGSNNSGRSSLDKIRATLPGRKASPDMHEAKKEKDKRPAPIRVVRGPVPGAQGTATSRKERKKRARMNEMLQPPDTKAVNELRPLFVEVVSTNLAFGASSDTNAAQLRPLLKPKPLTRLPPSDPAIAASQASDVRK